MQSNNEITNNLSNNKGSNFTNFITYLWTFVDITSLTLLLLVQATIIDYYLIYFNDGHSLWYFLFLMDFIILIIILVSIGSAKKYYHLHDANKYNDDETRMTRIGKALLIIKFPNKLGKLPLLYISWFMYSLLLSMKIIIIYKQYIPVKMLENLMLSSPKILELTFAVTVIIFLLLIETHRNNYLARNEQLNSLINHLTTQTIFEIFDSIYFLNMITPDQHDLIPSMPIKPEPGTSFKPGTANKINISSFIETIIILLTALNFILPTIELIGLSKLNSFEIKLSSTPSSSKTTAFESKKDKLLIKLKIIAHLFRLIFIDITYLLIRIHLSASYDKDMSIFMVKNILGIIINIKYLYNGFIEYINLERNETNEIKLRNVKQPNIKVEWSDDKNEDNNSLVKETNVDDDHNKYSGDNSKQKMCKFETPIEAHVAFTT